MSVPNLVILALFCVKLSSEQGLVYRPTDQPKDRPTKQRYMNKAIYPHFVEGGHNELKPAVITLYLQPVYL